MALNDSFYHKIRSLSEYLEAVFKTEIGLGNAVPVPSMLSFEEAVECQRLAKCLGIAFQTKSEKPTLCIVHSLTTESSAIVRVPWSAEEYISELPCRPRGFHSDVEERLANLFPPLFQPPLPEMTKPCIIVDSCGVILLWYLPGILSQERQVGSLASAISVNTDCFFRLSSGMLWVISSLVSKNPWKAVIGGVIRPSTDQPRPPTCAHPGALMCRQVGLSKRTTLVIMLCIL